MTLSLNSEELALIIYNFVVLLSRQMIFMEMIIMEFSQNELDRVLSSCGADLIGYADLTGMLSPGRKAGVSVAVKLPREVILSIHDGPNRDYFDLYHQMNAKLDEIVLAGEKYIRACGYHAAAQTTDAVEEFGVYRTKMPHKTVAVRSGLGWIGKSALFVTEQYGSAVRLSSVLTDAPLKTGTPVTESRCGSCMICTQACPGKAISGIAWNVNLDRDAFFDPLKCRKKARELAAQKIHEEITLCGKCIEVCPYTRNYLKKD